VMTPAGYDEKLASFLRWMERLRREDCAKYERISLAIRLLAARWQSLLRGHSDEPNIFP